MSKIDWLGGLDEESIEKEAIKDESYEPSGVVEAGIYTAKVVLTYLSKARESDAVAFNIELETEDGTKLFFKEWIKNRDGIPTYTDKRTGEVLPLPGVRIVESFVKCCGLRLSDLKPEPTTIEINGGSIDVKLFKEPIGKKVKVAVQQYEDDYSGEVKIRYKSIGWLTLDGKNFKGEDKEEQYKKRLEKTPCIKLKKKSNQQSTIQTEEAKEAIKGW